MRVPFRGRAWRRDPYSLSKVKRHSCVVLHASDLPGFEGCIAYGTAYQMPPPIPRAFDRERFVKVAVGRIPVGATPQLVAFMLQALCPYTGVYGLTQVTRRDNPRMASGLWFVLVERGTEGALLDLHSRVLWHGDRVSVFHHGAEPFLQEWCTTRDAYFKDLAGDLLQRRGREQMTCGLGTMTVELANSTRAC